MENKIKKIIKKNLISPRKMSKPFLRIRSRFKPDVCLECGGEVRFYITDPPCRMQKPKRCEKCLDYFSQERDVLFLSEFMKFNLPDSQSSTHFQLYKTMAEELEVLVKEIESEKDRLDRNELIYTYLCLLFQRSFVWDTVVMDLRIGAFKQEVWFEIFKIWEENNGSGA